MMGNYHVQLLGGNRAVKPLTYPVVKIAFVIWHKKLPVVGSRKTIKKQEWKKYR
jgi:hypothetical protein